MQGYTTNIQEYRVNKEFNGTQSIKHLKNTPEVNPFAVHHVQQEDNIS